MLSLYQIIQIILTLLPLFFFILLLTFRKKRQSSNLFLVFYFLIFFLQNLFASGRIFIYPYFTLLFFYIAFPLVLLNAPLLFLYVKKITSFSSSFKTYEYIHFVPSLIVTVLNILVFNRFPFEEQLYFVTEHPHDFGIILSGEKYYLSLFSFFLIQIGIYSITMLLVLYKHGIKIKNNFSYEAGIQLIWLRIFVVCFLIITIYEYFFFHLLPVEYYMGFLVVHTGFLGFFAIKQTEIYSQKPQIKAVSEGEAIFSPLEKQKTKDIEHQKASSQHTYDSFHLSTEELSDTIQKIKNFIENEKAYLNPELSLNDLVAGTCLSRNLISYVFNFYMKTTFYQFINEYRIEEAKKILHDIDYQNLSIEGIAQTAGFKSKSVFNPMFKSKTGQTPSEFRKKMS